CVRGLDLQDAPTDPDGVADADPGRSLDSPAVDERPVERPQVLDLDRVADEPDNGMPSRDFRVVDRQLDTLATDHALAVEREALPGQRSFLDHDRGAHSSAACSLPARSRLAYAPALGGRRSGSFS